MEKFADLFEEESKHLRVKSSGLIKATVVEINDKNVVLSTGLKSDSTLNIKEFLESNGDIEISIGDEVDVCIVDLEDNYGDIRLSREKAKREAAWRELEDALTNNVVLVGFVRGRTKGGLSVDYKGINLFLPGSLIDNKVVRDFTPFENKDIDFMPVKIDRVKNNVVISRKVTLPEMDEATRQSLMEKMQPGAVVRGTVKNITNYGAFLDLGGIDGLIHITDMSWTKIIHPSEVLELGQEVDAVVINVDHEKHRVALNYKQLTADPWDIIVAEIHPGDIISGKITNISNYGVFVEVRTGIEGLAHISEMDWVNRNPNPHKLYSIGQEIQVQVLEVVKDRRRVSLGIKQTKPNPWLNVTDKVHIGDVLQGEVRSSTNFGIFVALDNGLDGLVHISDLSYDNNIEQSLKQYKRGSQVEVIVLDIDPHLFRIALGIKQLCDKDYVKFIQYIVNQDRSKWQKNNPQSSNDDNTDSDESHAPYVLLNEPLDMQLKLDSIHGDMLCLSTIEDDCLSVSGSLSTKSHKSKNNDGSAMTNDNIDLSSLVGSVLDVVIFDMDKKLNSVMVKLQVDNEQQANIILIRPNQS